MAKRLLIDAVHPEEFRVAALDGERLVTVDVDTREGSQLAGNLYVASVARVEASLQAAFVDFGGERHGFLPFSEIHPDYFQLPNGRDSRSASAAAEEPEGEGPSEEEDAAQNAESSGEAEEESAAPARRGRRRPAFAIQEVIRNRQVMLVQVHKEPRGDKGAVLTTYISLAGRYCVLMPNAGRGGGVSRKISADDRKRLREIAGELDVAPGHGVIIRTAGSERTRPEIKRDYTALLRQWEEVRERALTAVAPKLIHQESNLMRRAVRDLYDRDTEEILVEGEEAYQEARRQMRMLTPSHVKNVKQFNKEPRDAPLPPDTPPIFARFGVERQLGELFSPRVTLPSGGSIVISPSEALTAIDVNSGRSTGERNIEETAYRTNLEAADVVARQLRLRDISGLVVIDFIDMDEERNRHAVERRFRDRLRADYSRTQIGRISSFGLLEMSRQRLARSLVEMSTVLCGNCEGAGRARSPVSLGLALLRRVEAEAGENAGRTAVIRTLPQVAEYLTNHKRADLGRIEARRGIRIYLRAGTDAEGADGVVAWHAPDWDSLAEFLQGARETAGEGARERRRRRVRGQDGQRVRDEDRDSERRARRGRRSRTRSGDAAEAVAAPNGGNGDSAPAEESRGRRRRRASEDGAEPDHAVPPEASEPGGGEDAGRRRRRRRTSEDGAEPDHAVPPEASEPGGEEDAGRRRRRGRRVGRRRGEEEEAGQEELAAVGPEREEDAGEEGPGDPDGTRRRRRGRRGGRGRSRRRPESGDAPAEAGAGVRRDGLREDENGGASSDGMRNSGVSVPDDFAQPDIYDPYESAA